jgi:four helix bundle protein
VAAIFSFKDLDAWQLSMDLAEAVHHLARRLPVTERFALASQLRRAAISIPSNVAEGHARETKTYRHHVRVAIGSLAELETQVELARRFEYVDARSLQSIVTLVERVGRILHRLERSLRQRLQQQRPRPSTE